MKKIFGEYILPLVLAGAGFVIPKEGLITNIIGYALILLAILIFIIFKFKSKTWFPFKNYVFSSPIRKKTDHEISVESFNEEDDET